MLARQWIMNGAISGFFGVVLGAFGGHALKNMLSEKALSIYNLGVQYQMIHALALIGFGLWAAQNPSVDTQFPGWAFTFGIVAFSGSLYTLALTDLRFLGMITPLGGLSFLAGWIGFAFLAWKA
jgi:uncharacterized membrane protein YgdD (TMEM256/DUF423 family)